MKLYGFEMSPNVRRVQLALAELGLEYELVPVDLMQGEQKKPPYLALNPSGRVPTLVDGDLVLWESHAICEYLAAKAPEKRLDAQTPAERGEIAKWTYLNAAHFGPSFARVFAHTIRLPEDQRLPRIAEEGRAEVTRILGILDEALEGKEWLVGGRLTLADLSYAPSLGFAPMLGFDLAKYPNIGLWLGRMKQRPSLQKILG